MAVSLITQAPQFHSLSTDVKPIGQPKGARLLETDTSRTYTFDGTIWKIGSIGQPPPMDLYLEIAKGNVDRHESINKFGESPNGVQATATDIWDRADSSATQQIWLAPTASRIHEVLSTSDEDSDTGGAVAQGSGCRTLRIQGLTSWDAAAETVEDVILDGTDGVDTVNAYVIIYRMKALTFGDNGPNVGTITAVAATDATVTAAILANNGQTMMAIYGVPSTRTAYMTSFYVNLHDNATPATTAEVDFTMLTNESPDIDPTVFLKKHSGGTVTLGTGAMQHFFQPCKKIIGPAIIKMQALGNKEDLFVTSGFDLVIVEN